jgi:hydroxylaminobenzene mutase
MSALARLGLCELAVGALLGWLVAMSIERREWLARLRITSPKRILQCHLDFIIMGVILIAVSVALPGLAPVWKVAIAFGSVVNPSLFGVLAFSERAVDTRAYRAVTLLSFTAMSGGLVAAAVTGLTA